MKLSSSTLLLFQSLIWLDIASKDKSIDTEWHERDLVFAAIFHGMWLTASGLA